MYALKIFQQLFQWPLGLMFGGKHTTTTTSQSVYWIVSNAVAMFTNPKCPVSVELFASGNKMSSVSFTDNSD